MQKVRKFQKKYLGITFMDSLSFVTPANFPRAVTVRSMANDITYTMYAALPIHAHTHCAGYFERPPFTEGTKRSVYHVRSSDVFRLKQV